MKSIKFSFGKILLLFVAMALITSCDEELPDVGSIADETPPEAAFSYSPNEADWKQDMKVHQAALHEGNGILLFRSHVTRGLPKSWHKAMF